MTAKSLSNWTVLPGRHIGSLFWGPTPPKGESFCPRLMGEDTPGHTIITSRIVSTTGCTVTTKSGTLYSLCNQYNMPCPDQHFYDLLARHGLKFHKNEPIKALLDILNKSVESLSKKDKPKEGDKPESEGCDIVDYDAPLNCVSPLPYGMSFPYGE